MGAIQKHPIHALFALVIGLPVLYVTGFGPACWISQRLKGSRPVVSILYAPLLTYVLDDQVLDKPPIQDALNRFARFGAQPEMHPVRGKDGIHWLRCGPD